MAQISNLSNEWRTERFGNSAFYITDDESATETSQYTKCTSDFHDGGFKKLTDCTGRFLIFRRTGSGMINSWFSISSLRAFTVTNLLEGATVIEAPDPKHSDFVATNLVENIETRSSRQDINPITDWDGSTVTRSS